MSAVFQGLSVAVLLGGHAAERSVSLDSGANVANALVAAGANVRRIDTRDEGWMATLTALPHDRRTKRQPKDLETQRS